MDECGRGSLAGPLVAAAVVLKKKIKGLKDSKKLSPLRRQKLARVIVKSAIFRIEMISVRMINSKGIGWANKEIFKRLIKTIEADKYIVDGNLIINVRGKTKKITSLVKADTKILEVMAASIIAKEFRDKLMRELHEKHSVYGWKTNVGYGTDYHIRAIAEHGIVHYHRSVFVMTALKKPLP